MDSPSDLFRQQLSQLCPFGLYGSPPGNTTTDPHYPGGSSPSYPLISPLLHHNSATQRWGGYRHQAGFSPGSLLNKKLDEEVAEEMEQLMGRREVATGVAPVSKINSGSARRPLNPDPEKWDQDTLREKRQRMDRVVRKERGMDGEGNNERKNAAGMVRGERRLDEDGKRKGSREGKQQERQKLKLQLEETRDKLLDLQRKLCRAYGEHGTTEERRQEDGEEEGVIDMDEVADTFSEEEMDEPAFPSELTPPLHASNKNKGDRGVNSGVFPGSNMDLDVGLDGGEVWLGCSFIRGQWESFGEGQKFAQALKQELASAVARVIDRVVRLYVETDAPLMSGPLTAEENPTRPTGGPNPVDTQRPNGAAKQLEHLDALPLVSSRPQDKRMALNQGAQTNPLLPRPSPSLLPLPQHSLPALLPPRSKDPFLPSYPPAPAPPLPLPLLQYTMQHLFARSLSNLPLHKDCLSNEPFLEFRTHNPSFPPLPLLGQLEPSMVDRGRDGGMRGGGGASGADGGDASLYLGPGSEGLSPCHLKKAKLMFFYARYPSSSTLKTYFPDVKFNRCVTSQLIKWFSNFREFFYIQMERFARQAAREGLPTARERALRLGRDSELYRILNMHYNKSNDYQVPDRFVEVSELALREFFTAIHSGRDVDPCWKKSIYKIICKLDSPVPDSFRLPGCPMETHRLA